MNEASLAVLEFAEAILHGDEEHRRWLRSAAQAFVAGKPLPPVSGGGLATPAVPSEQPDADK